MQTFIEREKIILSYLIGALADGSLYHNKKSYVYRVTYYQKSKEYHLRCIEPRIEKLFGKKGHFYCDHRKGVYFYEVTSKKVFSIFKEAIEDFKSKGKRRVPSWIRNGASEVQNRFIRGFFDADGFYTLYPKISDYRVRFGQSEYFILADIKEILQPEFKCSEVLGPYQSKKRAKPYWELHLYGKAQVIKFHEKIRPCHPQKHNLSFQNHN
ncbi:MAG: LAGLIDADG family homing endonuclease [Candidatus Lokiarchaeota archaeon]